MLRFYAYSSLHNFTQQAFVVSDLFFPTFVSLVNTFFLILTDTYCMLLSHPLYDFDSLHTVCYGTE